MAIKITPNSAKITFLHKPSAIPPKISTSNNTTALISFREISFSGEVMLDGVSGDSTKGWRIGWLQVQSIETNWAYYRGENNGDGSIFLQFARSPARTQQSCRDIQDGNSSDIFYNNSLMEGFDDATGQVTPPTLIDSPGGGAPTVFPISVKVNMFDAPAAFYNLVESNLLTKADNYLYEAQMEYHFCAVLTVQAPDGKFYHQAYFYWNVRGQANFRPEVFPPSSVDWRITPTRSGSGTNVGRVFQGAPDDKRFVSALTAPQMQNCNEVAESAITSVSRVGHPNRHESPVWQNFDVRKP